MVLVVLINKKIPERTSTVRVYIQYPSSSLSTDTSHSSSYWRLVITRGGGEGRKGGACSVVVVQVEGGGGGYSGEVRGVV